MIGIGIPGAFIVGLWLFHHPALAWWFGLLMILALVLIAGYRLQKRLLAKQVDQGFLESLGRLLEMGRWDLDEIEDASRQYQEIVDEAREARRVGPEPFSEEERAAFERRLETVWRSRRN